MCCRTLLQLAETVKNYQVFCSAVTPVHYSWHIKIQHLPGQMHKRVKIKIIGGNSDLQLTTRCAPHLHLRLATSFTSDVLCRFWERLDSDLQQIFLHKIVWENITSVCQLPTHPHLSICARAYLHVAAAFSRVQHLMERSDFHCWRIMEELKLQWLPGHALAFKWR